MSLSGLFTLFLFLFWQKGSFLKQQKWGIKVLHPIECSLWKNSKKPQKTLISQLFWARVLLERYFINATTLSKGFIKFISLVVPATKIMY